MKWDDRDLKWAPFEKRLTTVMMIMASFELGSPIMKSRAKSSQGRDSSRIGWRRPAGFWVLYLVYRQSWHSLMYCCASRRMLSRKKLWQRRHRVLANPMCPPNGDLWYSSRRRGIKGLSLLTRMRPWYSKRSSLILNAWYCEGSLRTRCMRFWNSANAYNSFFCSSGNLG